MHSHRDPGKPRKISLPRLLFSVTGLENYKKGFNSTNPQNVVQTLLLGKVRESNQLPQIISIFKRRQ